MIWSRDTHLWLSTVSRCFVAPDSDSVDIDSDACCAQSCILLSYTMTVGDSTHHR